MIFNVPVDQVKYYRSLKCKNLVDDYLRNDVKGRHIPYDRKVKCAQLKLLDNITVA